ncbi:Cell division cycle 5-like protein [Trichinella britovi]|uniref:Cell division cycle 5-like protein n=1 Tax=Trichinella britovi TaxID=45882 RepID=A0A0V1CKA6_TRIBR|nr:Cell division cycle 5-like protein [Trichinella britovi]KRZ96633.1 Cell division cycle 5-like protein [Trichinella sp. T8]
MVRVIIKGGVWRNTEDEILKAAVMKYGKNQWSRIASLLHRKSAKQCKARWFAVFILLFEWLDPSIKKTEWSREEDEKLLHLAKLMPTQWRTIAPIVGRTASQCLERYEFLLDQAQKKLEGEFQAEDDPRKLRPGEIDPCPETKPARPDPIDMDEDELEMLSEARARLANTQGKKAKRKAREKQLEEARRMASLQKRRELRAAGIAWGRGRKFRKGIDYNEEIPFEKKPAPGFHDPSEDTEPAKLTVHDISKQLSMERALHDSKAKEEKRRMKEKIKQRKEEGISEKAFNKMQAERKRSKLVLPEPQISENDLEGIIKVGKNRAAIRDTALMEVEDSVAADLLPEPITLTPHSNSLRTPLIPQTGSDAVMTEAENLLKMQNLETPLKGGLNPEIESSDFSGITPRRDVVQTPNIMMKSLIAGTPRGGQTPSAWATPASSIATMSTPYRDDLNINADSFEQKQTDLSLSRLRKGFAALPAPKNDFEILPPEEEPEEETVDSEAGAEHLMVKDAADLLLEEEEKRKKAQEEFMKRQSQAVQRSLPRPVEINNNILRPANMTEALSDIQKAEEIIKKQLLCLLHYDSMNNPTVEQLKAARRSDQKAMAKARAPYIAEDPTQFSAEDLEKASRVLDEEWKMLLKIKLPEPVDLASFTEIWKDCYSQFMYHVGRGRFSRIDTMTRKEKMETYQFQLQNIREQMSKEAKKAMKLEQKVKTLLRGYQARLNVLTKEIQELTDDIVTTEIERKSFLSLEENESRAVAKRINNLMADVQVQEVRERELQTRYAALILESEELNMMCQRRDATLTAQPVMYEKE